VEPTAVPSKLLKDRSTRGILDLQSVIAIIGTGENLYTTLVPGGTGTLYLQCGKIAKSIVAAINLSGYGIA